MTTSRWTIPTLVAAALCGHIAAAAAAPETPPQTEETSGLAGALLAARHARVTADTATATEYYDKALRLDPGNTALLQRSYSTAAAAGRIDAAIAAAQRYYDSEQEPLPLAGLLLATGHFAKKEYAQAWPYIERIKDDSYLGFALPMIRAWTKAARDASDADAVLAELAPMQSIRELGDLFTIMSGLLNEYLGRREDALIHYDVLAGRVERQPLATVRLIVAGYHRLGKSGKVKPLLAKYAAGRGGFGLYGVYDALANPELFRKKLTPQDGLAEAYFAISQILSQGGANNAGFGDVAVSFGQMALYLNPDLPMGRWILGSTLSARLRYDEAIGVLTQVRKTDPAYLAAQLQVVDSLAALGQRGDALARLQALAREYPTLADIQIAMGDLLRRDQKFADAVVAYDKAEQLLPGKDERELWSFYYGRGIALERTKQWARAEADFKRALQLNPDQPDVLNYLGYSWIDRGENIKEARRLIELAYSKAPENGFIVDSLGWVMYLEGDYAGAVTFLEKAVELEPSDPTLNDHLGDAYWKVGRRTEARFQWQRALSLKPEDKQRTELLTKLERGLAQN
jgi:tetratricopeptide (TPR) repeat protein